MEVCTIISSVFYGYDNYDLRPYFVDAIKANSKVKWFSDQKFSINGHFQPVFAEILTKKGAAFTFNMLDAEKLFNFER